MDRTVTVTGQGAATAVPDLALVRLAAAVRARRMAEALAGVSAAVELIGRTAAEFTEPRRIASRDLNVWPATDHQGQQTGFEARHAVEIGCPSLDVAGAMLEALAAAVGDQLQVEGVMLQVAETGVLLTNAREAAYADAVIRATHLASLAGASLGAVLAVSEGSSQHAPYADTHLARAEVGFHPGETSVGSSVTVTFALA